MSRGRDNCPLDCKVYVGELGNNATRHELEDAFGYYGPLRNVWVARNPPGKIITIVLEQRRGCPSTLLVSLSCGLQYFAY